mgnify:CR=1 FL=1
MKGELHQLSVCIIQHLLAVLGGIMVLVGLYLAREKLINRYLIDKVN